MSNSNRVEYEKWKEWINFKRARYLVFSEKTVDIINTVRTFEIITIYQNTKLAKEDIAKILKIKKDQLSPAKFKTLFNFSFPKRNNPYIISFPVDAYPLPNTSEQLYKYKNIYKDVTL